MKMSLKLKMKPLIKESIDFFDSQLQIFKRLEKQNNKEVTKRMKNEGQNSVGCKLTIFKPQGYIYKLSKCQTKNSLKNEYETYFNSEYSLRKYNHTINLANQSQFLLYEWRKQCSYPIVKVVYLQLLNRTISSSGSQNGVIEVSVYTQHIEKILADMINLTLGEAIYVLKECLLAYQELLAKFSAVSISKFYSGLNAEGKLKVWVNDNLSLNTNVIRSTHNQLSVSQTLVDQAAIVNKIIHIVGLLANASCKYFFYGMEKELIVKRFSFNNSLQYINSFATKTKNLEIPTNLAYMLPKKNSFGLDRSNVKFLANTRVKTLNEQRKNTYFSALNNTNSFKHFGSFVRLGNRQITDNDNQNDKNQDQNNQNKIRFKRYSQQIPKNFITSLLPSKKKNKKLVEEKQDLKAKQYKISLHMIIEKNRRGSVKSNDILPDKNSSISQRQRPSICIVPGFITKQTRGDDVKEVIKQHEKISSNLRETEKSQKSKKSYSLQSSKSKDYHSLVNSKIGSSNLKRFRSLNKDGILYRTQKSPQVQNLYTGLGFQNVQKNQQYTNIRSRSVSANIKFSPYGFADKARDVNTKENEQKELKQTAKSHRQSVNKADKTSNNSISNEGTTKKRSFLTKTNYDSNTDENEKNQSFYRMDFSSMSIENRITNKNFDSDLPTARKQELKRSLMSYKFGFQQIMENPSCKQVQEENQTKSYNGSSLRNTQNITEQLYKPPKKNEQTTSNNFSFGNNSNRIQRRHLKDSVEQNWDLIKQKNDEFLVKNQWKKTINNLEELQNLAVNESIVDVSHQMIVRKDIYADVKLQKLQRLGKNMCFSIINRNEEGISSLNSSLKRLDAR